MRKSFVQKLVVFMLFAFCGQVIAAPFFNCCVETNQKQNNAAVMDHHMMGMESDNLNIERVVIESSHDHDSMTDSIDCNHMCDFCIGSASSIPRETTILAKEENSLLQGSDYIFFNSTSNSDNPFRPPIIA